jgi:ABC-type phosphate transport system substrate-binding protein
MKLFIALSLLMTGNLMKRTLKLLGQVAFLAAIAPPAMAELVIVVNPQNPATRMFPSQAAQFFLGGSVLFVPVEQAENSPLRAEFYKKVLEKEPAQVQAIWSKLTFTGKAKPPKEYKNSSEVKKAVSESLNAIGYIEKSAVDDSVKVIATIP